MSQAALTNLDLLSGTATIITPCTEQGPLRHLVPRPTQSRFQFIARPLPARAFGPQPFVDCVALVPQSGDLLVVLAPGLLQRGLHLRNRLIPLLTLLGARGFFPTALDLSPPLLPLEFERGLASLLFADLRGRSLPRFRRALAATTSGSTVSRVAP
jgi:hypothetical protein